MTRPPTHNPDDAYGIAALIGGMLGAFLCAWLRWFGRGEVAALGDDDLGGTLTAVLVSQAAIDLTFEPYVEWEAVPAPWRNGRLLPARHERALSLALPLRRLRLVFLGRGPPLGRFTPKVVRTGMEGAPCAGVLSCLMLFER